MRNLLSCGLFLLFTLLLTGCANVEKEKPVSNAKITIEPYKMSKKESELISKTGIDQIEFFKLAGELKEEDDLQFSVEVYEKGKYKEELLTISDEPEKRFEDSIISFGISNINDEDYSLKLIAGLSSGRATANFSNNMTSFTFNKLVGGKVTLEKNKPVYLVAWIGTTKNELSSSVIENGELPEGDIKKAETALLYRVLWTNGAKE